jgi:peptidylprolyl isomerase
MRTWIVGGAVTALFLSGCGERDVEKPRPPPVSAPAATWDLSKLPDPGPVLSEHTTPEGVRVLVLEAGEGEPSTESTMMDVQFTGYLRTGEIFESGVLPLGGGGGRATRANLIPGWRVAVEGLRPKERRRVLMPAAQAYGWDQPQPHIPPGSDLVFDLRWSPFEIHDLVHGTGDVAKEGDVITVHYVGRLASGRVFEDSRQVRQKEPVELMLSSGKGGVIAGWARGIPGMRVGGKRRLHIPWHMGYGRAGNPVAGIPPKTDLIFTVELLGVRDPKAPPR